MASLKVRLPDGYAFDASGDGEVVYERFKAFTAAVQEDRIRAVRAEMEALNKRRRELLAYLRKVGVQRSGGGE